MKKSAMKWSGVLFTAFAALILCGSAPVAHAQLGCGLETPTLRPINGPGCANMVHRCGCDSSGCSWVWVCSKPDGTVGPTAGGFNGTYQAPGVFAPVAGQDSALKAQDIRNLELQNKLMQQEGQLKQQKIEAVRLDNELATEQARIQRELERIMPAPEPTPPTRAPGTPNFPTMEGTVVLRSDGVGHMLLPKGWVDAYFCTIGSRDDHVTIGFSSLVFTISGGEPGQKITWACIDQIDAFEKAARATAAK